MATASDWVSFRRERVILAAPFTPIKQRHSHILSFLRNLSDSFTDEGAAPAHLLVPQYLGFKQLIATSDLIGR